MNLSFDRSRSVEDLEGRRWLDPPSDATPLVRAVHALRKSPISDLTVAQSARLIGQDVGLPWLLPVGVEVLRSEDAEGAVGGWFDDDLLTAVLTRNATTWAEVPELAQDIKDVLDMLGDELSPYLRDDADRFRASLPH
ncbi:contact-dependent growth inhibition system immunity protein [Streptomyces sp. NPDC006333]|uniref:contact-dependent growth inhibition system immunity protein n=1 Tax=Streptomyces sp. NPDC006333 TaxID=3156753 RepID=UPI0033AAF6EF